MRLLAFSVVLVLASAPAYADKISDRILLHRELKRVPDGVAESDHLRDLYHWGFAASSADAERCAIYVEGRLLESEIEALEGGGLRFDDGRFVPSLPGRHPHGPPLDPEGVRANRHLDLAHTGRQDFAAERLVRGQKTGIRDQRFCWLIPDSCLLIPETLIPDF